MKCRICDSLELEPLFQNTIEASEWVLNNIHYGYVRCAKCGYVQCEPLPSDEDLSSFYKNLYAYEWFERNSYFKKIQARHRAYKIRHVLKPGLRYLDFGCGHGFFVQVLLSKKLDAFGFDIGAEKIASTSEDRITYKDSFDNYVEQDFDMITAWHVIEHMRDPHATIAKLAKRLKTGGILLVAVPNLESAGFRQLAQKWGWTQQPYVHISHFSSSNLSLLLERNGFKVKSVRTSDTWDQNIYDMLISHFFYRNKSRNPVRKFEKSFRGEIFFRLNQAIRLVLTPVSYALGYLRHPLRGSELRIIAVKQ